MSDESIRKALEEFEEMMIKGEIEFQMKFRDRFHYFGNRHWYSADFIHNISRVGCALSIDNILYRMAKDGILESKIGEDGNTFYRLSECQSTKSETMCDHRDPSWWDDEQPPKPSLIERSAFPAFCIVAASAALLAALTLWVYAR